jgi:hypothetical protein
MIGVEAAEKRPDADRLESGGFGGFLENSRFDHFDIRPAFAEPAADSALENVQAVHPVERHEDVSGRGPTEFPKYPGPFIGLMDMMKKPDGENEVEDAGPERETAGVRRDRRKPSPRAGGSAARVFTKGGRRSVGVKRPYPQGRSKARRPEPGPRESDPSAAKASIFLINFISRAWTILWSRPRYRRLS